MLWWKTHRWRCLASFPWARCLREFATQTHLCRIVHLALTAQHYHPFQKWAFYRTIPWAPRRCVCPHHSQPQMSVKLALLWKGLWDCPVSMTSSTRSTDARRRCRLSGRGVGVHVFAMLSISLMPFMLLLKAWNRQLSAPELSQRSTVNPCFSHSKLASVLCKSHCLFALQQSPKIV